MILRFIFVMFAFNGFLFSSVDDSMIEMKKELKTRMFDKLGKKNFKIAVVNFKDVGEEASKSKAGEVVSSVLSKHFVNDSNFIVVERNRMEKILEELRLNMLGVVDEKEIKRVGLILGVDWLVIGEVSFVGGEFVVNARVANSETAEIIAASTVNIEKEVLIKESLELTNLSKNYFGVSGGFLNLPDLNFNSSVFGLELRHNYSRKSYFKFSFLKTSNNTKLLDRKSITQHEVPGELGFDTFVDEKIESVSSVELVYGFIRRFILKTRIKAEGGVNFSAFYSKQNIYYPEGGSTINVISIPSSNNKTYYVPGLNVGFGIEKNIFKSHIISLDFKYGKFKKFNRDVSVKENSSDSALQNYIDSKINSQKITADYTYMGISFKFPF